METSYGRQAAYKVLTVFVFWIGITSLAMAQSTVSGRVLDVAGQPIIGATVKVTGQEGGAISDLDGNFRVIGNATDSLLVSFIGFASQVVPIGNRSVIEVVLKEDIQNLQEVVVTALGIERDKKALGYAVQQIDGDALSEARTTNVMNGLAGQAAGVQVTGANNGLGSSARIVIRGENSLNINSNSPLIVVDGSPINNNIYGTGSGAANQSDMPTDFGNGAADINPDDIASISILKGAAASA
ncbi:MAG TPA: SusC/RagA family TonB-linked outer membrane protein, partial [Cytophagales bacterium]|nr:SusC/RagA family TonB-linked outer membrane protein [Cytophagales bacterium]